MVVEQADPPNATVAAQIAATGVSAAKNAAAFSRIISCCKLNQPSPPGKINIAASPWQISSTVRSGNSRSPPIVVIGSRDRAQVFTCNRAAAGWKKRPE